MVRSAGLSEYRDIGLFTGDSGFLGAIGKVGRANFQLRELNERFRKYTEERPYRIGEHFDLRPAEEIGDYSFLIENPLVPNREWGVLIGEIVHNLRSALDHAVYAAAGNPSRNTFFPVYVNEEDWDKKSCGPLYSVPDKVVALVKQAQPYRQKPNSSLHEIRLLNAMWNHDKHRLLHATVLTLGKPQPGIVIVRDVDEIVSQEIFLRPLEKNVKIANAVIRPNGAQPKLKLDGNLALGVAFGKGIDGLDAIGGKHVIAVLTNILRVVMWLVGSMEVAAMKS
jgi:hypothetical protein